MTLFSSLNSTPFRTSTPTRFGMASSLWWLMLDTIMLLTQLIIPPFQLVVDYYVFMAPFFFATVATCFCFYSYPIIVT